MRRTVKAMKNILGRIIPSPTVMTRDGIHTVTLDFHKIPAEKRVDVLVEATDLCCGFHLGLRVHDVNGCPILIFTDADDRIILRK